MRRNARHLIDENHLTIKTRIWIFQCIVAFAVIAMAATSIVALHMTKRYADQVTDARKELSATARLAVDANRYSEQIAELILMGPSELSDFQSARNDVHNSFQRLQAIDLKNGPRADDRAAPSRYTRMGLLMDDINNSVERLLALYSAGKRDDAIVLFRIEIENRLDREFEQLVAKSAQAKRREVAKLEAAAGQLQRNVTATMLTLLAILLSLTFVSSHFLTRSINRPIRALTAGTRAIEHGSLQYRIGSQARDEFGELSHSFDAMATQLQMQHAMLTSAKNKLEEEVAQRTQDLAQANQRLTQVDQQRVRFLGDISHELRTSLTAVRGEAEIALRAKTQPESLYRESLTAIVARAEEMTQLIEDLLFVARSEGDDIHFEKKLIDLHEIAQAAMDDIHVLAQSRDIKLVICCDDPKQTVSIFCDIARLKQAIMIALDNAIKYSLSDTTICIYIRSDGQMAELSIKDQGVGCPSDDVPYIFHRFYRGTLAQKRWKVGTGLGLPIARWIVDKHNGSINFSSTVGKGSTLTIRLPLGKKT